MSFLFLWLLANKHPPPDRGTWLRGPEQNAIHQVRPLKQGGGNAVSSLPYVLLGIQQHFLSPWVAM